MDPRLEKALEKAKENQLKNEKISLLKDRAKTILKVGYNGGIFTANPSLIQFTRSAMDEEISPFILMDDYDTPIKVDDVMDFYAFLLERHQSLMLEYYNEYNRAMNK